MSRTFDDIYHSGIISEINKEKILVSIISHSACASCKVKGMCNVSEMKEKIIEAGQQLKTILIDYTEKDGSNEGWREVEPYSFKIKKGISSLNFGRYSFFLFNFFILIFF